jgi:hypothetical protein
MKAAEVMQDTIAKAVNKMLTELEQSDASEEHKAGYRAALADLTRDVQIDPSKLMGLEG